MQAHHPGPGGRCDGFGQDEGFTEPMVEPNRGIAGDFNVLALVITDRHLVGVVQQDVCGLQCRVGEQPAADEVLLTLGRLVLELCHS